MHLNGCKFFCKVYCKHELPRGKISAVISSDHHLWLTFEFHNVQDTQYIGFVFLRLDLPNHIKKDFATGMILFYFLHVLWRAQYMGARQDEANHWLTSYGTKHNTEEFQYFKQLYSWDYNNFNKIRIQIVSFQPTLRKVMACRAHELQSAEYGVYHA